MEDTDFPNAEAILTPIAGRAKLSGEGVSIATFAGFNSDGHFLVELSSQLEPMKALSTIAFTQNDVGTKVVIAFERGNVRRPIIIGRALERAEQTTTSNIKIDGERITLKAEREIELRCGDASIVLTRAGKILIRGNYVLSRSRGANKIKGAFVDIN